MQNFWQKLPKPILALAPMAGYTDSSFRQICRSLGADIVYSEMVSTDAICFNNRKTLNMLKHEQSEHPLVLQLFGSQPEKFAKAVKIVESQRPNKNGQLGIDINFGCPAHKITKNGSGAALMDEIDQAIRIIKAVAYNTRLPVSIKIRVQVKNVSAVEFISRIKHLPWSTVMVHGRSLKQSFSGHIDYKSIKKIKQLVPDKIIIANGGINNIQNARQMLKQTGADGLGIARGAWGNPWLFQQIKTNKAEHIAWTQRKKLLLKHARLFSKYNDNLIPLRKQLIHYVKGLKNAAQLRQQLVRINTLKELKDIVQNQSQTNID